MISMREIEPELDDTARTVPSRLHASRLHCGYGSSDFNLHLPSAELNLKKKISGQ